MKKQELRQIIKEEYKKLLKENEELSPEELKKAKAYFDPIVKKHGGKIINYFKSFNGDLAAYINIINVIRGNLVVANCFSKSDANKFIKTAIETDINSLVGNIQKYETRPDKTYIYMD